MNKINVTLRRPPLHLPGGNWASGPGRGLTALAVLSAVGILLVTMRGLLTGNWWFFVMLSWNLCLAFFPLGVVLVLRDLRESGFRSRWLLAGGLLLWLAFLPNAPYIITDLFHLKGVYAPLLWFDTMAIFLFAQAGLLAGLYSVLIAHRLVRTELSGALSWGLVLGSQWLAGYGIYLGRFGRWNSWHILTKPTALVQALWDTRHDHLSIKLTLTYGFVLAVLYVAFYWYVDQKKPGDTSTGRA